LDLLTLEGGPEAFVRNYPCTLRNILEENGYQHIGASTLYHPTNAHNGINCRLLKTH